VGGGIAGLAAAFELSGGARGPTDGSPAVTVLEGARFGGMLRCARIGDQLVDVGPDGFLARRPEAAALVQELGASDQLEPVGAAGAWVFVRGKLRLLPPGLALGVPTRLGDVRTMTAISVLGVAGALRASLDLVVPRPARRSALQDRAIGPLVADKLGRRVVDRLVDPLVGGINAGRVNELSAAAVFPPLLAAAQRRGSLMRALQAPRSERDSTPDGPAFLTLRGGLGTLPDLLVGTLASRGVAFVSSSQVTGFERTSASHARWTVSTVSSTYDADAVVLATPASVTAGLLAAHDRTASGLLARIDAASVATVTLRFARDDVVVPDSGTGVLVPAGERIGGEHRLVTAITFLDRKWPHLATDGSALLRASVGRIDDDRFASLDDESLVARVIEELSVVLELYGAPTATIVERWPHSFPQYRVNHLARIDTIEAAVRSIGGLAVCGAAYRGVGIPACIASGRSAATGTELARDSVVVARVQVEARYAGGHVHVVDLRVVLDGEGKLEALTAELVDDGSLEQDGRVELPRGPHHEQVPAKLVGCEPADREVAHADRTGGHEEHLDRLVEQREQGPHLDHDGIVDTRGEERLPVRSAAFQEVLPALRVGDHPVDVDHDRPPRGDRRVTPPPVRTRGVDGHGRRRIPSGT
jgi:oxygen-dependent protoporphyrinogen oxidase